MCGYFHITHRCHHCIRFDCTAFDAYQQLAFQSFPFLLSSHHGATRCFSACFLSKRPVFCELML